MFSITPGTSDIDTNCSGCNATNTSGVAVLRFRAAQANGKDAAVIWSLGGGDAGAGAGSISAEGQYTPPSYLTADRVRVLVTAALKSDPAVRATAAITVTPGFLQPLSPENAAVGATGSLTVTGLLAEAGGNAGIHFALSDSPTGVSGGKGSLGTTTCQHENKTFTSCSVTYFAPAAIQATDVTYVVATATNPSASVSTAVLLNTAGVSSTPSSHQDQLASPMLLGSSGGNNSDYDAHGNTIVDCCSATLGALIQDQSGRQYLLGNNHSLARSDHASIGDAVVQPGLIDNNCTPNGDGGGTVPVAALANWLPLKSSQTNADAAIAEVNSHMVDPSGSILELGARQANGTLAAAPPGVSSTGGKGETASLQLRVAKSGRTTGLTCGGVSAIGVDVSVDYYRDCAETRPYLTRTFTNQIGISGNHFSDAGDSGALVVDVADAEPVGLYFAGGVDVAGVSQGMASPAPDVLNELGAQAGEGTTYTFVGGADHAVSCLSYGNSTVHTAQAAALGDAEIARVQESLALARGLVNPTAGILGVAMGKSTDHPGEGAVIVYVNENGYPSVPDMIGGVRTMIVPTNARAVALGAAPMFNAVSSEPLLSGTALSQALAIKRQLAPGLMRQNPAFFAVGVGQSLDNPGEAALVIYVDRNRIPASLPQTLGGLRTRYIIMNRLHVTRAYAVPFAPRIHCTPHSIGSQPRKMGLEELYRPMSLGKL